MTHAPSVDRLDLRLLSDPPTLLDTQAAVGQTPQASPDTATPCVVAPEQYLPTPSLVGILHPCLTIRLLRRDLCQVPVPICTALLWTKAAPPCSEGGRRVPPCAPPPGLTEGLKDACRQRRLREALLPRTSILAYSAGVFYRAPGGLGYRDFARLCGLNASGSCDRLLRRPAWDITRQG